MIKNRITKTNNANVSKLLQFHKKIPSQFQNKIKRYLKVSACVFYVPERSTTNCGPSESQRFTRQEPWEPFRDGPHRWDRRRERRTRITRWGTGRSWRCRTGSCRLEWGACTRLPPNWAPNWKEFLKKRHVEGTAADTGQPWLWCFSPDLFLMSQYSWPPSEP